MRDGLHAGKEIADLPTIYLQGIVRYWSVDVPHEAETVAAAVDELWKRVKEGDYRIQIPRRAALYCGCRSNGRSVRRFECVLHKPKEKAP